MPGGGSGLLRLAGSTPTVTAASGAGHRIESGIALDATPTFAIAAAAARLTVDGAITNGTNGLQGLVKGGAGTLALLGANTFSGAIDIAAGTLELGSAATLASDLIRARNAASVFDASALSGAFVVDGGRTLAGNGTFLGDYVVQGGGVIAPGNSVGGLTYEVLTFGTAGVFDFEINNATGTPGIDPGWDLITVTDSFSLDATDLDPFVVRIISLSGTAAGLAANFNPNQSYQWKFLVAPAEIGSFSEMKFALDVSGFQNPTGGAFSVLRGGGSNNELYIAYTAAIPEPGTLALTAIGLAAAAVARRRARQRG